MGLDFIAYTIVGVRLPNDRFYKTIKWIENCDCPGEIDRSLAYCPHCGHRNNLRRHKQLDLWRDNDHDRTLELDDYRYIYIYKAMITRRAGRHVGVPPPPCLLNLGYLHHLQEERDRLYDELSSLGLVKDRDEFDGIFGIYTEAIVD